MKKTIERFQNNIGLLRCPLCGSGFTLQNSSLVCGGSHCFDISSRGTVNFLPNQKPTGYGRELFTCRRAVFEDGFYDCIADKVVQVVEQYAASPHVTVLDAGCGEGYFARRLRAALPVNLLAMDIEKEAVRMAAGQNVCMVADIANIPVTDGSADILLNILSPANYAEFARILRPGGVAVKVVPGSGHLAELKSALGKQEYSNERVTAHFADHLNLEGRQRVTRVLPVSEGQLQNIARMTLMGKEADAQRLGDIQSITIDAEILIGKKVT